MPRRLFYLRNLGAGSRPGSLNPNPPAFCRLIRLQDREGTVAQEQSNNPLNFTSMTHRPGSVNFTSRLTPSRRLSVEWEA